MVHQRSVSVTLCPMLVFAALLMLPSGLWAQNAEINIPKGREGDPPKGATKTAPALVNAESSESAPSTIRVGPNVHVSVARSETAHYEVVVAADPINPNRLLACSIISRLPEFSGAYLSTDGGQQWRAVVATDSGIVRGDPDCAIGRNEKAYFIQMSNYPDDGIGPFRPGSYYSHDGGTTWTQGFVPMDSGATIDRPWVVVDNGANSPYHGQVYLYGQVWGGGWTIPIEDRQLLWS